MIVVYTVEYYPTSIRNTSLGNMSAFARVAGIISTFTSTMLGEAWVNGPYLLFFCITSIGALVNTLLDEDTLGRPLDTVAIDRSN